MDHYTHDFTKVENGTIRDGCIVQCEEKLNVCIEGVVETSASILAYFIASTQRDNLA